MQDVAGALDYAHRQGVVHRDIKPENILLQDGQAIVADFGIARAIATGVVEAGTADTIPAVGTPAYMSPEQASGEGPLDGRTDIYALGCVLYEMLAGAPPFTGPSAQVVLDRHAAEPAPPLAGGVAPPQVGAADQPRAVQVAGAPLRHRWRVRRGARAARAVPALVALAREARRGARCRAWSSRSGWPWRAAGHTSRPPPRARRAHVVAVLPFRVSASTAGAVPAQHDIADRLATRLSGRRRSACRRSAWTLAAWRRVAGDDGNDLTPDAALEVGRASRGGPGYGRLGDGHPGAPHDHRVAPRHRRRPAGGPGRRRRSRPTAFRHCSTGWPRDCSPSARARIPFCSPGPASASLPALRAYLAGREAYRRGRIDESLGWFQQATVLDSTFAPAAFEVFRVRRRGDDGRRAKRLALAGRTRLVAADQALLDILTGPPPTGPGWIDGWQAATVAHPAVAEAWYGLGDAYFHNGLSAGVTDPFRYAGEAMRRGWAIDSAQGNADGLADGLPFVADPLRHLVELAQMAGDTAAVRRMVAVGLAADSTGKEGWYLRWHRAVALGDAARRRFWAAEGAVDPEAFGRMFEFIESSGIALEDYVRAAELDTRHWEATGPAGGLFERGMVALDGGRPRESARLLGEIENRHAGSPRRPMGWRMGEGGDPGIVGLALYWGADTARGAAAARRLERWRGAFPDG